VKPVLRKTVVSTACRTTAIRNVYNWRVKETERMVAIVTELRKLGATVEEGRDYCVITPPAQVRQHEWSKGWVLMGVIARYH
jgi:5-enolpyruvylshikimate-3-phosphate synthase